MLSSREGPAVCPLQIQGGELARMHKEPRSLLRRKEQVGKHRLDSRRADSGGMATVFLVLCLQEVELNSPSFDCGLDSVTCFK